MYRSPLPRRQIPGKLLYDRTICRRYVAFVVCVEGLAADSLSLVVKKFLYRRIGAFEIVQGIAQLNRNILVSSVLGRATVSLKVS